MNILRRRAALPAAVAASIAFGACDDPAPPVAIDDTGQLEGFLYFDVGEDGVFDPSDGDFPLANVAVTAQNRGTGTALPGGNATSGSDGRFVIAALPLGTHDLLVDEATLPPGPPEVNICQNPLQVSIFRDETHFEDINGRPGCLITILAMKDLADGDFAIVQGLVTSFPGQVESGFAFIEDATGGLFLNLTDPDIEIGDRIEVGGTIGSVFGNQLQLQNIQLRSVEEDVLVLDPMTVTTADVAASGADPRDDLQNRFIRIEAAQLTAAFGDAPGGNEQNGTIDDGTGPTTIRVDDGVVADRGSLNTVFTVGACYNINGFAGSFLGAGQIFPRSLTPGLQTGDIVEVPCP